MKREIPGILVGVGTNHPDAVARIETATLVFDEPLDGVWPSDHFGVASDIDLLPLSAA